jgi:enamine deaminase RidA (YjgF/YER057c/UK114 family)
MTRRFISSGSTFETQMGYSRAIVAGEWVFVSGTTGYDYSTMTISDDIGEQTAQCFANISAALASAGSSLDEVVRVTYVLPDAALFERCWPAMRSAFASAKPAAMMIQAGLSSPDMLIEIEVTALKGSAAA